MDLSCGSHSTPFTNINKDYSSRSKISPHPLVRSTYLQLKSTHIASILDKGLGNRQEMVLPIVSRIFRL